MLAHGLFHFFFKKIKKNVSGGFGIDAIGCWLQLL